jgi:hypothetical protein
MSFLSRRSEHTSQTLKMGGLPQGGGWRFVIRPLWLLSLGLHLLVLRLPLPATQSQPQTTKSVKITKLTATPKTSPPPSLPVKASVAESKPAPKMIAKASVQQPNKKRTQPVQNPASPKVTPTPSSTPTSKPKNTPELLSETALKQLLQFPNAKIACGGNCAETTASLSEVATYFSKKLAKAKLNVEPLIQEQTRQVLKLQNSGLTRFLSILTRGSNTVYALADQAISLEDLKRAEESVTSISDVLGNIKGFSLFPTEPDSTAQSELFQNRSSEWIEPMNLLEEVKPDDAWNTVLKPGIQASGFDVSLSPQPYGGGKVYVLKRPLFTGYLNLVPSKEGNGTVIVLWKVPPN